MPYCSLSCVRRWGFIIMDHCCKDLGIPLVPGQHCPRQADTSRVWKVEKQTSSTVSTAKGIFYHRPFVCSFKRKFSDRVDHHYSCYSCECRVCTQSHQWTCSQQWRFLLATRCLKFFSSNNIQNFVIQSKNVTFLLHFTAVVKDSSYVHIKNFNFFYHIFR
jgi:hypothetical protein